ncbi:hypothetical protein PTSG_08418 [Salpingoeca rosetta]|uniref:ATP synthase subunit b n=1 Tax=Salpingoeca rosetta (strain ATCC 50818 / BSB-021) TaxID=946362 RepID=F2UJM5_SALR5|nr:uncharacterized protein PTSG_08418 [Salpingoeca rosetta]EGD77324.1 hypothetical protein PTSG_08418 [Salpingoeca rosetta]|eukprot:XP_004990668.1 hypothetical protein PTSG_08418 [Salpingoeca rosetta]
MMALRSLARVAACPVQRSALAASQRTLKTAPVSHSLVSDKTGKTGAAVLTAGIGAYLLSQEVLILHNETVVVAAVGAVTYGIMSKAGKDVAGMLDERAQAILESVNAGRRSQIATLEQQIEEQKQLKTSMEGVPEFFDAVREYEAMRRELAFREEQYAAYQNVIGQLENMVSIESSVRSREQDEIVQFLAAEVPKALKGKEEAIMNKCIADLQELSAQA